MVVIGKKFDIRVWVLVTSVTPLTVFMFTKPYLRFTSEDYDPTKLSDKFMHLTNASISKNNYNAKKSKAEGKYEIVDNMWHTEDFAGFLADQYGEDKNCKDPLRKIVFPQIKEGVITSLLSVAGVL